MSDENALMGAGPLSESQILIAGCGARRIMNGVEAAYDFGFVRSSPGQLDGMVRDHNPNEDVPEIAGDVICLWEDSRAGFRRDPLYSWQLSGSCVNSGGFNSTTARIGIESLYLPDPETPIQAFTLAAYGASRYMAFRDDREGEGSSGDAMARALGEFGFTSIDDPNVPKYHVCGPAIVYDRPVELKYSAIHNCPDAVKANCKQHNLQYVAVKSAEEGRAELRRRRPLTFAGDWGGLMECEYRGEPRVLMNRRAGTWNHQQCCLGAWFHPTLGWIYFILNNWYFPVSGGDLKYTTIRTREGTAINTITQAGLAKSVHGLVTRNEPAGGYWISEKDFDYQCRTGEVRGLLNVRGFMDRPIGPGNI